MLYSLEDERVRIVFRNFYPLSLSLSLSVWCWGAVEEFNEVFPESPQKFFFLEMVIVLSLWNLIHLLYLLFVQAVFTKFWLHHLFSVSISSIFPLPNHSSWIFFRDITNDAKKRWNRWNICDRWDSIPQVKMDGTWKQ